MPEKTSLTIVLATPITPIPAVTLKQRTTNKSQNWGVLWAMSTWTLLWDSRSGHKLSKSTFIGLLFHSSAFSDFFPKSCNPYDKSIVLTWKKILSRGSGQTCRWQVTLWVGGGVHPVGFQPNWGTLYCREARVMIMKWDSPRVRKAKEAPLSPDPTRYTPPESNRHNILKLGTCSHSCKLNNFFVGIFFSQTSDQIFYLAYLCCSYCRQALPPFRLSS